MDKIIIGAISALVGSIIGASVAITHAILTHRRDIQKHNENLLVNALTLLAGNENERSAGLSIIEGKYLKDQKYTNILVPALTSQSVFLLLHTEKIDSRTEFYNWLRIMELLEVIFTQFKVAGDYYGEIGNSFLEKVSKNDMGGINMSMETLSAWAKKYGINNLEEEI